MAIHHPTPPPCPRSPKGPCDPGGALQTVLDQAGSCIHDYKLQNTAVRTHTHHDSITCGSQPHQTLVVKRQLLGSDGACPQGTGAGKPPRRAFLPRIHHPETLFCQKKAVAAAGPLVSHSAPSVPRFGLFYHKVKRFLANSFF